MLVLLLHHYTGSVCPCSMVVMILLHVYVSFFLCHVCCSMLRFLATPCGTPNVSVHQLFVHVASRHSVLGSPGVYGDVIEVSCSDGLWRRGPSLVFCTVLRETLMQTLPGDEIHWSTMRTCEGNSEYYCPVPVISDVCRASSD